jgi:hypothetical protein
MTFQFSVTIPVSPLEPKALSKLRIRVSFGSRSRQDFCTSRLDSKLLTSSVALMLNSAKASTNSRYGEPIIQAVCQDLRLRWVRHFTE